MHPQIPPKRSSIPPLVASTLQATQNGSGTRLLATGAARSRRSHGTSACETCIRRSQTDSSRIVQQASIDTATTITVSNNERTLSGQRGIASKRSQNLSLTAWGRPTSSSPLHTCTQQF
mmetsp:Transcript_7373/g.19954  ORF Transcript_7373/g.19954 Transcript_7373/m.19954 type:complete len:119 (-) Transcript_7373:167-523(-)